MVPKFYIVSDIHGFYDEMMDALYEAGFDENNENHWLITCGDHWDRGPQPVEVMNYLMSLPRKILCSGNHEQLFKECVERGYFCSHDISNGTMETICEIGGADEGRSFDECCVIAEQRAKRFLDSMVNYFETEHYVFCHGFLPVNCDDDLPYYYERNRKFSKKEDWRHAHQYQWDQAMWLNGMKMVMDGIDDDKCIVVGHYHSSWGRAKLEGKPEFGEDADFSPFYYKDKLIAIDSCCTYSGKLNCLVLEDDFIDDKST